MALGPKELRLIPRLEISGLTQDIKKLKASFKDGLELGPSDLQGLKKEFKSIADTFKNEIKSVVKELQNIKASAAKNSESEIQTRQPVQKIYDYTRGKEVTLRGAETYSFQTGRKYSSMDKREQHEEYLQSQAELKEQRKLSLKKKKEAEYFEKQRQLFNERSLKELETNPISKPKSPARDDFKKHLEAFNRSAESMPQEQEALQKERQFLNKIKQEKLKINETLAKDKAERELGVAHRVAKSYQQFLKTGKFDFIQESDSLEFRRRAEQLGIDVGDHRPSSRMERVLGGGGASFMRGLAATGALLGGAYGVGRFIGSSFEGGRDTRATLARRDTISSLNVLNERILENEILERTRNRGLSTIQEIGADLRGGLSALFQGRLGDFFSGRAMFAERFLETEREAAADQVRAQPLIEAFNQRVRPLIGLRAQMLAGGGINSSTLTDLQGVGAEFGFGGGETLEKLLTLRQQLGNTSFRGPLGQRLFRDFARTERQFGVDSGLMAEAMQLEQAVGGRSLSPAASMSVQRDFLKRAVTAGLDASKTGRALEVTTNYLQSNAGFGAVDTDRIRNEILRAASGFAAMRGSDSIELMDLQLARDASQLRRSQSIAQSGLSGLGNYAGILQAAREAGLQLSTGQFLSAVNLSADATESDALAALGPNVDPDKAAQFVRTLRQRKQNTGEFSRDLLGVDSPLFNALMSQELGLTTEQFMGLQGARAKGRAPLRGTEPEGALGSIELGNLKAVAQVDFKAFSEAFTKVTDVNNIYINQINRLVSSMQSASQYFDSLAEAGKTVTSRNPAPQAPRTDDGEAEARSIRSRNIK